MSPSLHQNWISLPPPPRAKMSLTASALSFVRKGLDMLVNGDQVNSPNAGTGSRGANAGTSRRRARPRKNASAAAGAADKRNTIGTNKRKAEEKKMVIKKKKKTVAKAKKKEKSLAEKKEGGSQTIGRRSSSTSLGSDRSVARGRRTVTYSAEYLHGESQLQLVLPSSDVTPSLARVLQTIEGLSKTAELNPSHGKELPASSSSSSTQVGMPLNLQKSKHLPVSLSRVNENSIWQVEHAEYDADSEDELFLAAKPLQNGADTKREKPRPSTSSRSKNGKRLLTEISCKKPIVSSIDEFEKMIEQIEHLCYQISSTIESQGKEGDDTEAASAAVDAAVNAVSVEAVKTRLEMLNLETANVEEIIGYWKDKRRRCGPLLRRFQKSPLLQNWSLPTSASWNPQRTRLTPRAGPKRSKILRQTKVTKLPLDLAAALTPKKDVEPIIRGTKKRNRSNDDAHMTDEASSGSGGAPVTSARAGKRQRGGPQTFNDVGQKPTKRAPEASRKSRKIEMPSPSKSRAWDRLVAELGTSLADTELILGPRSARRKGN